MTHQTVTIRKDDLEALLEAVICSKLHPTVKDMMPEHSVVSLNAELLLGMYETDKTILGRMLKVVGEDPYIVASVMEDVHGEGFSVSVERYENIKTPQEEDVLREAEKAGHVFTDRG